MFNTDTVITLKEQGQKWRQVLGVVDSEFGMEQVLLQPNLSD